LARLAWNRAGHSLMIPTGLIAMKGGDPLASDGGWAATATPEPGGMQAGRTPSVAESILLGPNGVRAGWRLLVFAFLVLGVT
jgi:hypothetical protein